jgi:hypothetical protein
VTASATKASSPVAPPTTQQIDTQVARTYEVTDPNEVFTSDNSSGSAAVTVGDGDGGYLTAVTARRNPSADGHGWLVFFWHNQRFVGWDTNMETWNVQVHAGGPDSIEAEYPVYAKGDAACCPSLPPVTITYRWGGAALAQSTPLPPGSLVGIAVT